MDGVPVPVFATDAEARIVYANDRFRASLGESHLGERFDACMADEMRGLVVGELRRLVDGDLEELVLDGLCLAPSGPRRMRIRARRRTDGESGVIGVLTPLGAAPIAGGTAVSHSQRLLAWSQEAQLAQSLDDLVALAQREVESATGYQCVWLYMLDPDRPDEAVLVSSQGERGGMATPPANYRVPVTGDVMVEEIVEATGPIVIDDARIDPRTNKDVVAERGSRTIINIPLTLADNRIGAFGAGTFDPEPPRRPTPDQLEYLAALASHIAAATWRIRSALEHRQAIERQRRLELQLAQTQKLQSLGTMAAGAAHDFNNFLVGILGNVTLAQMALGDGDDDVRSRLAAIRESAERASQVTREMMSLSASPPEVRGCVDLVELIRRVAKRIRPALPAGVDVLVSASDCHVPGDATQLERLVANLILNGADAIGDGRGSVAIAASTAEIDQGQLATAKSESLPAGKYVEMRVRDTGRGMDAETVARVFEPFFSTKRLGRGLGMASVRSIVERHRGAVVVESEPGRGTTVRVVLPRDEIAVERTHAAGTSRGRILIVEREQQIRSLVSDTLGGLGYDVVTAEDEDSAMSAVERHGDDLTMVLLDHAMPGLSGRNGLDRLRAISPRLPIMVTAGDAAAAQALAGLERAAFLEKPYDVDLLHEAMELLLTRADAA